MKLTLLPVIAAALALGACKVETKPKPFRFKAPDIRLPDFKVQMEWHSFLVCDKDIKLSDAEVNSKLSVQGPTDFQDVEGTDCDGNKSLTPKMPSYTFEQNLTIEPVQDFSDAVTFVTVENPRTCVTRSIYVRDAGKENWPTSKSWITHPYYVDRQGRIILELNDSPVVYSMGLNVLNGKNALKITYFGECLEKDKEGVCIKGKELGKQIVLLAASIERRENNGIRSISTCNKPKKN